MSRDVRPIKSHSRYGKQPAFRRAPENYRIHVIDRAAAIMDCFVSEKPELSVTEITSLTGLHKSTAHRILAALQFNGLIQQNPENGKYHLGIKLFRLGHQAVARLNLREIARPYLTQLMEQTQETAHLAVLDEGEVLFVDRVEGRHSLRMQSRLGRAMPIHCTSMGKAILACFDAVEVTRVLQKQPLKAYTPKTLKSVKELLVDLELTHRRGYSIDDEESEVGLRCVGAPVQDYSQRVIGAVSIAGPSGRITTEKIATLGGLIVKAAGAISGDLGFSQPQSAGAQR